MSRLVLGRPGMLALTVGWLVVATLTAAPPAFAACADPTKPVQATIKFQDAPANVTFFPPPAATPLKIVLQIENCSTGSILTTAGFSSTDFFRRLYFTDPAGNTIVNTSEETIHAFNTTFFCNSRGGALVSSLQTIPVVPVEVLAGPQGQPAVPHFFREFLIDIRKFYELPLPGLYRVNARIDLLTFTTTDPTAVFADCDQLPATTVVNVGAVTGRRELTVVSNTLEFLIAGRACSPGPNAVMTRAVDPSGTNHGIPTYTKLQAAYNDAADCGNEVIGLFGHLNENVVLGGNKALTIMQSAPGQITAADSSKPVVDITSSSQITIVGAGVVGGSVGWRVGGNGGHALKDVRAAGASQHGIQLLSNSNRIEGATARQNSRHGVFVSGSDNAISDSIAQSNGQDGFNVAGGDNLLDLNTATSNTSDGFKLDGRGNTIKGSSIAQSNGQSGFNVTGGANLVDSSTANNNTGTGFKVSGAGNSFSANTALSNGQDGFNSATTGSNTRFDSNTANRNIGDGFEINGAGSTLTSNQSNTSASAGTNENSGAEYRLNVAVTNGGGNTADGIGIPKTSAPPKCAVFPAKGVCE